MKIVSRIIFILGAGAFAVMSLMPLTGPAVAWGEAMAGIAPGGFFMLLGHLLHVRSMRKAGQGTTAWWAAVAVLLALVGGIHVVLGPQKVDEAEEAEREAYSKRDMAYAQRDEYGYRSAGDDANSAQREAKHFAFGINFGWGALGASVLFVGGALVARGRGSKGSGTQS